MPDTALVQETLIALTADIVSAHVSKNSVSVGEVSTLIANVHTALSELANPSEDLSSPQEPAVSIRSSVKPDYIICLEDGKKLKTLKRHLMTTYKMSLADYRAKWSLPSDYPMVAPNYTAKRKELAVKIGLGRKAKQPASENSPTETPLRRGRKPKAQSGAEPA